ncbi:related to hsp70 protein [Cephalotrichum gorgonifer]|uniref:Related to hsp70 protein n=1 Tax=Cephalotrichum gorgonifer TaxID=2041049 RepID=A0AAE8N287_9PEZI|nr:related to hsp70 protein [Cephalotrichum gorgonifer]
MGELKSRLTEDVVNSVPIDFVITVPAIWTDQAKEATGAAAREAGLEAATVYTLKDMAPRLGIGQKLVVCDAGGGTVDLVTYQVIGRDPLALKEVTEGTGGKNGSSMLNERFRRHLKATHGEGYWTNERLVAPLQLFEQYKKTWTPGAKRLFIDVEPGLNLHRNRYAVPEAAIHDVFEPIIKEIIKWILAQIKEAGDSVFAVLLVGGFGQSGYLETRVKAKLPSYRHAYGFDAVTAMDWLIKKGESYPEGKSSSVGLKLMFSESGDFIGDGRVRVCINTVDHNAPAFPNANTHQTGSLSIDLIKALGLLQASDKRQLRGGVWCYVLEGNVEANYGSAMITYTLSTGGIIHDVLTTEYN